jgi:kojibiose phosphorylase
MDRMAADPTGEMVEINTGDLELHISADVCWAILQQGRWTGRYDRAGPGGETIREVARWWASRAEVGADGRAHLRRVIGPDEYHEAVDDNAFTNQMARWTLRRAAESARRGRSPCRCPGGEGVGGAGGRLGRRVSP